MLQNNFRYSYLICQMYRSRSVLWLKISKNYKFLFNAKIYQHPVVCFLLDFEKQSMKWLWFWQICVGFFCYIWPFFAVNMLYSRRHLFKEVTIYYHIILEMGSICKNILHSKNSLLTFLEQKWILLDNSCLLFHLASWNA